MVKLVLSLDSSRSFSHHFTSRASEHWKQPHSYKLSFRISISACTGPHHSIRSHFPQLPINANLSLAHVEPYFKVSHQFSNLAQCQDLNPGWHGVWRFLFDINGQCIDDFLSTDLKCQMLLWLVWFYNWFTFSFYSPKINERPCGTLLKWR